MFILAIKFLLFSKIYCDSVNAVKYQTLSSRSATVVVTCIVTCDMVYRLILLATELHKNQPTCPLYNTAQRKANKMR